MMTDYYSDTEDRNREPPKKKGILDSIGQVWEKTKDLLHEEIYDEKRFNPPKEDEVVLLCPECDVFFNVSLLKHKSNKFGDLKSYDKAHKKWKPGQLIKCYDYTFFVVFHTSQHKTSHECLIENQHNKNQVAGQFCRNFALIASV